MEGRVYDEDYFEYWLSDETLSVLLSLHGGLVPSDMRLVRIIRALTGVCPGIRGKVR